MISSRENQQGQIQIKYINKYSFILCELHEHKQLFACDISINDSVQQVLSWETVLDDICLNFPLMFEFHIEIFVGIDQRVTVNYSVV